ncbi:RhoGAP domain containing protein [Tritrichomonas foetus]|uniref:RhoGAP domain containing protein n=1 Tax=Tritrichomonas foetus TaxID=1144522 RepID=A0A1J4JH32_9EUKA|nr:RhoGAP domain containing protein [Tritrichomonas foetus]|eukprot:OHS98458.1 RhoGAP domain containing protein [Tritrichomonas foetus]
MTNHPHFFSRPIESFGNKIPFIVSDLITKLREIEAKNIEGIFRLSGAANVIKNLTDQLDEGQISDWSQFNAITIACALKTYFREKAKDDPLLMFDNYDMFVASVDVPNSKKALELLKGICVNHLPKERLIILAYLMNYLHEVSLNEGMNKMSAKNLAICFAPNILVSKEKSTDVLFGENPQQNKVVTLLIENAPNFFGDVKITENLFFTPQEIDILRNANIKDEKLEIIKKRLEIRAKSLIPFCPPKMSRPSAMHK